MISNATYITTLVAESPSTPVIRKNQLDTPVNLDRELASTPVSLFIKDTFSVNLANLFKSELVNIGSLTIIS